MVVRNGTRIAKVKERKESFYPEGEGHGRSQKTTGQCIMSLLSCLSFLCEQKKSPSLRWASYLLQQSPSGMGHREALLLSWSRLLKRRSLLLLACLDRRLLGGAFAAFLDALRPLAIADAAENFTAFFSGILISFPVRGFLPILAFLVMQVKEPRPGNAILSFFKREALIVSTTAQRT